MKFKKPCRRCGKLFRREKKYAYMCEPCKKIITKEKYEKLRRTRNANKKR